MCSWLIFSFHKICPLKTWRPGLLRRLWVVGQVWPQRWAECFRRAAPPFRCSGVIITSREASRPRHLGPCHFLVFFLTGGPVSAQGHMTGRGVQYFHISLVYGEADGADTPFPLKFRGLSSDVAEVCRVRRVQDYIPGLIWCVSGYFRWWQFFLKTIFKNMERGKKKGKINNKFLQEARCGCRLHSGYSCLCWLMITWVGNTSLFSSYGSHPHYVRGVTPHITCWWVRLRIIEKCSE